MTMPIIWSNITGLDTVDAGGISVWGGVLMGERKPALHSVVVDNPVHPVFAPILAAIQGLPAASAAPTPKPTQHDLFAAKLKALRDELDDMIDTLPEQYLGSSFKTLDALEAAVDAWCPMLSADGGKDIEL